MIHRFKRSMISLRDHETTPLRIVNDGLIGTQGVGDGRMLPVLILDTAERPDVTQYLALHEHSGAGDVRLQWGQLPQFEDTIILILTVVRPAELTILIAFELPKRHGALVDQILRAKGLYLQAGAPGDRLANAMNRPRVLVEVADTNFQAHWEKIYHKFTVARLRKEGLTRTDAKQVAKQAITAMREVGDFRFLSRAQSPVETNDF